MSLFLPIKALAKLRCAESQEPQDRERQAYTFSASETGHCPPTAKSASSQAQRPLPHPMTSLLISTASELLSLK